jgi:serine protease Do
MTITLLLTLALVGAPQEPLSLDAISDSFEELAIRINPAIVQIQASGYAIGQGIVSQGELVSEQRTRGSGVILSADGYLVTNAHVVSGARRVRVLIPRLPDDARSVLGSRGRLVGAQVVGIDTETDLAVLKLQETGLPYVTLGDSDTLRPGQIVLAFGSPLGLENSVTMGVVSAVARQLQPEDPMIYIQTDASINPGNSGGPLVDTKGNVIGINTLILSQSGGDEGLGFAAPSNIVKNVFEQIRATGRVHRGEIGIEAQTITPLMARGLGLQQDWGAILADVAPGGTAADAGLQPGDIVSAIDGKVMENGRQLHVNIYQRRVGESVAIEVLRGSEKLVISVEVAARRHHLDRFGGLARPDENLVPQLGILGIDLDDELARMFAGLRRNRGVIVAARAREAQPWQGQGLLPGDVIYAVNRLDVSSLAELKATIARYYPGDPIVLQVERQGELRYVTLEVY